MFDLPPTTGTSLFCNYTKWKVIWHKNRLKELTAGPTYPGGPRAPGAPIVPWEPDLPSLPGGPEGPAGP